MVRKAWKTPEHPPQRIRSTACRLLGRNRSAHRPESLPPDLAVRDQTEARRIPPFIDCSQSERILRRCKTRPTLGLHTSPILWIEIYSPILVSESATVWSSTDDQTFPRRVGYLRVARLLQSPAKCSRIQGRILLNEQSFLSSMPTMNRSPSSAVSDSFHPFRRRNTSVAKNATRLLPSTNA